MDDGVAQSIKEGKTFEQGACLWRCFIGPRTDQEALLTTRNNKPQFLLSFDFCDDRGSRSGSYTLYEAISIGINGNRLLQR